MDSFSYIANADVAAIDNLYEQYKNDPTSVDESWQNFFKGFDFSQNFSTNKEASTSSSGSNTKEHTRKEMEVVHLIRGYRSRGHLLSDTNPIGGRRDRNPQLEISDFGLTDADLTTVFEAGIEVFGRAATLREIVDALRKILPLASEMVQLTISIPKSSASNSYNFLKSSGFLKSEEWLSDGSLKARIEINAGMKGNFLDRIGSLTKGSAQVKE